MLLKAEESERVEVKKTAPEAGFELMAEKSPPKAPIEPLKAVYRAVPRFWLLL